MKNRILACINVLLLAALAALMMPAVATASPDDEKTTEDVIYMLDGRELHGHILEESREIIVFQYVDRNINIQTKLKLLVDEIAKIERDVPIEAAAKPDKPRKRITAKEGEQDEPEKTYGARRVASSDSDLPSFYVVPVSGQMLTDINVSIYEDMVDDIRRADPDILVVKMKCRDSDHPLFSSLDRLEANQFDSQEFRDLINLFQDELRDVRQVLWIEDSQGTSSVLALSWKDIYMTPDARLGGLNQQSLGGFENWSDPDVREKMTAAWMGVIKGYLEYGDQSLSLADAMIRPKFKLSGTWKGRKVIWTLDTAGEYVVDNSDKHTVSFKAKTAEDLCISDGTAESLDDLALLLGIREYRMADRQEGEKEGTGERLFSDYHEDWRRSLERCEESFSEYQENVNEGTLAGFGKAKKNLERILAAMERYKAVELRVRNQFGVSKLVIRTWIEQLQETITAMRRSQRGGGRGGGRAPGGGGSGAGG